jgi:hypothetical protein
MKFFAPTSVFITPDFGIQLLFFQRSLFYLEANHIHKIKWVSRSIVLSQPNSTNNLSATNSKYCVINEAFIPIKLTGSDSVINLFRYLKRQR